LAALARSVVRWGVLIGGLVIIADLGAQALSQGMTNPDDVAAIAEADTVANYVLFAVLGFIVVRETGVMYLGAVAGLLAALLDGLVAIAAVAMAPPQGFVLTIEVVGWYFARNLLIGVAFAGMSGVVYALVQRFSGGGRRLR
jgi:hypothetical protein